MPNPVGIKPVGFAGVGLMGKPMAERLLHHGHGLVVWNRSSAKVRRLETEHGAEPAETPRALSRCDVVFLMLLTAEHVEDVLFGPEGVFTGEHTPRVIVNMSTIDVPAAERLRVRCQDAGAAYVAAPVSGSTAYAQEGRLTVVASGPARAFEDVRPLLEILGSRVLHVGGGLEANLIKLAVNMVIGATNSVLSEALALVVKGGVGEADYLGVLSESVIASPWLAYKVKQLVEHDFTPGHTLRGLDKDYRLMADTATSLGVPLPVTSLVHQQIRSAVGRGDGDADMIALLAQAFAAAGIDDGR